MPESKTRGPNRASLILLAVGFVALSVYATYHECLIDVPNAHMAILTRKTGKDLENNDSIAPSNGKDIVPEDFKGVQPVPLKEGRYYYNPYHWAWTVVPQVEIPAGKLGVRIRLFGENLPPGQLIAWEETQKGIVPEVLNSGRYAINARVVEASKLNLAQRDTDSYAEIIEIRDPVTIPAGFKGVVTMLSAEMPKEPNEVIAPPCAAGEEKRGIQTKALEPGTWFLNPYVEQVSQIDCRSKRYDLKDIGFPTRDGFWVSLEGVIEFRVNPKEAARVYVLFNEVNKDQNIGIEDLIVSKIILPNARAYTRLKGSSHSGKEFITGDTRATFQEEFQREMQETCAAQGIEVLQALVTKIAPPEKIADPVRRRQIAVQQAAQYVKEIVQQAAEQELAVQKASVEQKKAQVNADQDVVVVTVDAKRRQEVALIEADKRLGVAEKKLEAAKDLASAIMAKGKAAADVVRFQNEATAAGWQKSIEAFGGNGGEFARYTLLKKIAPAFKAMMVNTENSALMDIFKSFTGTSAPKEKSPKPSKEPSDLETTKAEK